MTHDQIAAELVAMAAEDQRVRAELAADRSLFDGYHPRMEAVHVRNAARLVELALQACTDTPSWRKREAAVRHIHCSSSA